MTLLTNLKPTESELEILQILWKKGNCTVRDVHEILEKSKDSGYTTTLKLMQIMHEKGLVARDTSSKTHIYTALVNQQKTEQHLVNEADLINALQNRKIAGAALDVYDIEPLPVDHVLRKLDNVLATPHIGYVTEDTYQIFYENTISGIEEWLFPDNS